MSDVQNRESDRKVEGPLEGDDERPGSIGLVAAPVEQRVARQDAETPRHVGDLDREHDIVRSRVLLAATVVTSPGQ